MWFSRGVAIAVVYAVRLVREKERKRCCENYLGVLLVGAVARRLQSRKVLKHVKVEGATRSQRDFHMSTRVTAWEWRGSRVQ